MRRLAGALSEVPDHRSRLGQRHKLSALLWFRNTGMLCECWSLWLTEKDLTGKVE